MDICICFSPNWASHVAVELFGIFKNNKNSYNSIKVYLLSDTLTKQDLNRFDNVCNYFGENYTYQYIDMTAFYRQFMNSTVNVDSRFSKYTLYRLAIPYLIPSDRLLYIDADALVCGNISEFYSMNMEDKWIIGCEDTGLQYGHKTSLGKKEDDLYLNAGVLLLDLTKIRPSKIADKWLELSNGTHFPAHDQDIFFVTCGDKYGKVHHKYNTSLSTSLQIKPEDIKICHYAGVKSPWIDDLPFADIWHKYQQEYDSIFTNYKPKEVIPREIYYVWVGGNQKPQKIQQCIDSWRKHCPTYAITEINEINFDMGSHPYLKSAYENKLYAFCNDYIRFYTLYHKGGIFLDSDVLMAKPLDSFLNHRFFSGQEINDKVLVTATMGAEPKHPLCKLILDYYDNVTFDSNNLVPNTNFITEIFKLFIKEKKPDGKIILSNDCHLYPQKYFCNYDHVKFRIIESPESYAYHLFQGSWVKVERKGYKL